MLLLLPRQSHGPIPPPQSAAPLGVHTTDACAAEAATASKWVVPSSFCDGACPSETLEMGQKRYMTCTNAVCAPFNQPSFDLQNIHIFAINFMNPSSLLPQSQLLKPRTRNLMRLTLSLKYTIPTELCEPFDRRLHVCTHVCLQVPRATEGYLRGTPLIEKCRILTNHHLSLTQVLACTKLTCLCNQNRQHTIFNN